MSEPLTHEHFNEWRRQEFIPHTVREEIYEKKVDRLWWTAVTALFMGGTVLTIFMWVLLQKNTQIEMMQRETHQIVVSQAIVVETLKNHKQELERIAREQAVLTTALVETLKVQRDLHSVRK